MVHDWLQWVWRAWHRLALDRPQYGGGMGPLIPGRIPWREVVAWADRHDQDAELLDYFVRELDTVYIEWHAAGVVKKNG